MEPTAPSQLVNALACLRAEVRAGRHVAMLYPVLCELVLLAVTRVAQSVTVDETATTGGAADGPGARVHDRWISPRECASRLNISMRTLRRRAGRPPYRAFCIPQPERGFKVSEMALDEHMRRERARG